MAGIPRDERRTLVECAAEGTQLLDEYFARTPPGRFLAGTLPRTVRAAAVPAPDLLSSANADHFYLALSVLLAGDEGQARSLLKGREIRADIDHALGYTEAALYRESEFERALAVSVARNSALSDQELRQAFSSRFKITRFDLCSLPRDRTVFFAKVNHGYWEYMRAAYDASATPAERFRDIDVATRVRRLRTSGVTQFWGRQIHRMVALPASGLAARAKLCVSLTAGTEPPALSIRKPLQPVTRGAAAGMLSLFETALPNKDHFPLGDGAATRALIIDGKLESFFASHVADSEACVFVVPPHLRQLDLVGFSGALYRFVVPPTRINEAWKAVAPTLLGYLAALGRRHKSITVLAQGASVASLLALIFADADALPQVRLRYFDLGRVLDVAVPEFLQKQSWAARRSEQYAAEGAKVFRLTPPTGTLISPF
jgi:hypothetical protein